MDLEDFELVESNVPDIRFGHINIYCSLTDKELLIMEKTRRSTSKEDHAFSCMQAEERLKIQHENILRMLWVDKDDSKWLANAYFEYPNEDLFDRQEKLKNPKELIQLLNDMLEGMAYLQRHKMVHGDFRPEYVYFNHSLDKYVLLDRLIDASPANQAQMNNIFYQDKALFMSPGMFDTLSKGKVKVRHNPFKSEVFALGMVVISLFVDESEILKCYNRMTKCFDVKQFRRIEQHLKKSVFVGHIEDLIGEYLFLCVLNLDEKQRLTPKKALKILRKGVCRVLDTLEEQVTQNADKANTVTEPLDNNIGLRGLVKRKPLEIDQLLTPSETMASIQIPSQTSNGFDLTGMPNMGKEPKEKRGDEEKKEVSGDSPAETEPKDKKENLGPTKLHEILLDNSWSHTNNETFYGSGSNQTDGPVGLNDIYDPNIKKLRNFLQDDKDLVTSQETFGRGDSYQIIQKPMASPEIEDKQFQSCQHLVGQESPERLKKIMGFQSEKRRSGGFPESVPEELEQIQESIFRGKPDEDILDEMQGSEYHINQSNLGLRQGSDADDGEMLARGGSPVQSPQLMQYKQVRRSGERGYFSYGQGEGSGIQEFDLENESGEKQEEAVDTEDLYSESTMKEARNLQSLKRDSLNIDFKSNNLGYMQQHTKTSHAQSPSITEYSLSGLDSNHGTNGKGTTDFRFPEKKSEYSGNLSSNSQHKSYSIKWGRDQHISGDNRTDTFNQTDDPSLADTFDREMRNNIFENKHRSNEEIEVSEREHFTLTEARTGKRQSDVGHLSSPQIDKSLEVNTVHTDNKDYQTLDLRNSISVDSEHQSKKSGEDPEEQVFSVSPASHDLTDSTAKRLSTQSPKVFEVRDSMDKLKPQETIPHKKTQIKFIKQLISERLKQMKKDIADNLVNKLLKSNKSVSIKSLVEIGREGATLLNSSSLSEDLVEKEDLKMKNYAYSEKKTDPESVHNYFNFTSENPKRRLPKGNPKLSPIFLETFGKKNLTNRVPNSKDSTFRDITLKPELINDKQEDDEGKVDFIDSLKQNSKGGSRKKSSMGSSAKQGILSIEVYLSENEKLKIEELMEENKNLNTMELLEMSKHFFKSGTKDSAKSEKRDVEQLMPCSTSRVTEEDERREIVAPPNTHQREAFENTSKSFENKSIQTNSNFDQKCFVSEPHKNLPDLQQFVSEPLETDDLSKFKSNKEFYNEPVKSAPKYLSEAIQREVTVRDVKEHKSEPKGIYRELDQKRALYEKRDSRSEEALSEDIYLSNNLVEGRTNDAKKNLEEAILGPIGVEGDLEEAEEELSLHEMSGGLNAGNQFATISEASEDYESDASFLKEGKQKKKCKIFKTGSVEAKSQHFHSEREGKVILKEQLLNKEKMIKEEAKPEPKPEPKQEAKPEQEPFLIEDSHEIPIQVPKVIENKSGVDRLTINELNYQTDKTDNSNFKIGFEFKESENYTHTDEVTRKSDGQSRFDSALFQIKNSEFASPSSQLLKQEVQRDMLLSKISEGAQTQRLKKINGGKFNQTEELRMGNGGSLKSQEKFVLGDVSPEGTVDLEVKREELKIQFCDIGLKLERFRKEEGEKEESESDIELEPIEERGDVKGNEVQVQFQVKLDVLERPVLKARNVLPIVENLEIKEIMGYFSGMQYSKADPDNEDPPVSLQRSDPKVNQSPSRPKVETEYGLGPDSSNLKESLLHAKELAEESNFSSTGKQRFLKNKSVQPNMIHEEMEKKNDFFLEDDQEELIQHHLGEDYSDDVTGEEEDEELYMTSEQHFPMERLSMNENKRFLVCSDQLVNLKQIRQELGSQIEQVCDNYDEYESMQYQEKEETEQGEMEEIGDFESHASIGEGESNYSAVNLVQRQSFRQMEILKNSFEPDEQMVISDHEEFQDSPARELDLGETRQESTNTQTQLELKTFGNEFSDNEEGSVQEVTSLHREPTYDIHDDLDDKTYSDHSSSTEESESASEDQSEDEEEDQYEDQDQDQEQDQDLEQDQYQYQDQNQNESEFNAEITLTDDIQFEMEENDNERIIKTVESRFTGKTSGLRISGHGMKELAGIHTTVSRFAKNQSETVNFTDQMSDKIDDSKINNYTQEFIKENRGFRKSEPIGNKNNFNEQRQDEYHHEYDMHNYYGKMHPSQFKREQEQQVEPVKIPVMNMSFKKITQMNSQDNNPPRLNHEIIMTPRESTEKAPLASINQRSVHDIINDYSKNNSARSNNTENKNHIYNHEPNKNQNLNKNSEINTTSRQAPIPIQIRNNPHVSTSVDKRSVHMDQKTDCKTSKSFINTSNGSYTRQNVNATVTMPHNHIKPEIPSLNFPSKDIISNGKIASHYNPQRASTSKSETTEMSSMRTFQDSAFKTEGISEPPSRSIILSKNCGYDMQRLPNQSASFLKVENNFRAQFESPILNNRRFPVPEPSHVSPKKQSVIPDTMVVSQVMTANQRSNRFTHNTSQVLSRTPAIHRSPSPSYVPGEAGGYKQNIKYRAPVIRSRSSRINSEYTKESLITRDSRFSPKPEISSKRGTPGNVFAQPLSKSIKLERQTQITRDSKGRSHSRRISDNTRDPRQIQTKESLFTQPPQKQSLEHRVSIPQTHPSKVFQPARETTPDDPISYCSIKTQEKYLMKNSTSFQKRAAPRENRRVSPFNPKNQIRISRSPAPRVSNPKIVVIEENRFGLKIRRKSTEPINPPKRIPVTRPEQKINRFKSPVTPMPYTFDKETLKQVKMQVSDLSQEKKPLMSNHSNWYQHSKIQVVESKILSEQSRQPYKGLRAQKTPPPSSTRIVSQVLSNNDFGSKQIQSKISKISDNIYSEMSFVINTKPQHYSVKNISEKVIHSGQKSFHQYNLGNSSSLRVTPLARPSIRSPSPRIIRKTITPRESIPVPPKEIKQKSYYNNPPRQFNCQTFKPVLIDQSSGLKLSNNSQMKKSFNGWHEISTSNSVRENRFNGQGRVVQSLHREDSPFRTRKTKVIRIEHSRSVDKMSSSSFSQSQRDQRLSKIQKKPITAHQSKPTKANPVQQNLIITKPAPRRIVHNPQSHYKIQNLRRISPVQIKVHSRLDTSKDILAKKQKMFKTSQATKMTSSRFVEEPPKKLSKMGILNADELNIYEPSKKLGMSAMKASHDGVNLVMYNTPSFDNVQFESNLSRMSLFKNFVSRPSEKKQ